MLPIWQFHTNSFVNCNLRNIKFLSIENTNNSMGDKKQRITNAHYRNFLDKGEIRLLTTEEIERTVPQITHHKGDMQAQAMVIVAYYTGGRPCEYLELHRKDFTKTDSYLVINMPPAKNGLPRPIYLQFKQPLVKLLWAYVRDLHPESFVFYNFRGNYTRTRINKKGIIVTYKSITDNLRYYFKKWFKDLFVGSIPPYYLRHNRFSKMTSKGARDSDIMMMKGAKTMESVRPYQHLSTDTAKKLSRMND